MTSLSNTEGFTNAEPLVMHRRSNYYNEMVVFRVKDTLFREPKLYFTENSEFFRALFDNLKTSTSAMASSESAGQSDETPLELEDTSVEDFESLLSVISPINPYEQVTLSINEWKSVLRLSVKWGISSLRKRCIQQLSPLPSDMSIASKILFARECKAVGWLVDAYNQLARRRESITEEEEAAIGSPASMRILCVREQWLVNKESVSSSICYQISDRTSHDYRSSILSIFHDEIDKMNDGSVLEAIMPDPFVQIAHAADKSETMDPCITTGMGKKKIGAKKKKKQSSG